MSKRLTDEQIAWHARPDSGSTPQEHTMAREIQLLRAVLAASPDHLPLARVAEIHADALRMGGCAEVNECELVALTAEVLQGRAALVERDLYEACKDAGAKP